MQSCCFSFEQHLGRWAVFRQLFHHAERAPRMTSSLTAESPTIQKLQNILGVDIGILATQIMRARKTRKEKMAEGTDLTTHELVQLQRNAIEISWLSSEKREAFVNMLTTMLRNMCIHNLEKLMSEYQCATESTRLLSRVIPE